MESLYASSQAPWRRRPGRWRASSVEKKTTKTASDYEGGWMQRRRSGNGETRWYDGESSEALHYIMDLGSTNKTYINVSDIPYLLCWCPLLREKGWLFGTFNRKHYHVVGILQSTKVATKMVTLFRSVKKQQTLQEMSQA
ncbi:hypothetical protein DY000_02042243 [Brassica cretica]|uniref:Uncharacterized protein n=1 Tax=Brassica cretica TaxID=69181 RepID=A0ABQ7B6J4_BRACR|nr:hypothetical protein DY000_02042243 [Brassica cretica]